jgi:hypothetical protein
MDGLPQWKVAIPCPFLRMDLPKSINGKKKKKTCIPMVKTT